jgi:hypothetical protein
VSGKTNSLRVGGVPEAWRKSSGAERRTGERPRRERLLRGQPGRIRLQRSDPRLQCWLSVGRRWPQTAAAREAETMKLNKPLKSLCTLIPDL